MLVAASFAALAPGAGACSGLVDVQVSADACGNVVAVSGTGNARGEGCDSGPLTCVSASGTGSATNAGGAGSCGLGLYSLAGCVAVSGTGDASNSAGAGSCGTGNGDLGVLQSPWLVGVIYPAAGCVAVSGLGNARNDAGWSSCGEASVGCVAVSGTGNAQNNVQASPWGCISGAGPSCSDSGCGATHQDGRLALGCIAVSGTGNAANSAGSGACGFAGNGFSQLGGAGMLAAGCVAASGTGDASNTADGPRGGYASCGYADRVSVTVGCVAVSGTGNAANAGASDHTSYPLGSPCGETLPNGNSGGSAVGCVAVSGTGSASNTVDGQDCATAVQENGDATNLFCVAVGGGNVQAPLGANPGVPGSALQAAMNAHAADAVAQAGSAAASAPAPAPWWSSWFDSLVAWFDGLFGGAF
jgi:hypothetical protein